MAKHRHRLFEIFDFHDEACDALTTKGDPGTLPPNTPWEDTKLQHLAVKLEDGITKVRFKRPKKASDPDTRDFRGDFTLIASQLTRNDKLLFDFTGLKNFSDSSINALGAFSNSLRHKGSRIVLCGMNDTTKACFFPARL